ncbi:hypothetical protein HIM_10088 [Hirsutella minnesotensis 3608]|uniref:CCHC-type domain-containing protein n=1 Tax=Hirsutella minnesotensis 3608 TaxID=1043627 RepID=A0A0F8A2N0_9HYPO|nr:hypothetical protein HIM_10088 [Hirsutella minnesotensis 3608]
MGMGASRKKGQAPLRYPCHAPLYLELENSHHPKKKVEAARQLDDPAEKTTRATRLATRVASDDVATSNTTERRKLVSSSSGANQGRAMLQKALELLSESRRETQRLSRAIDTQNETISKQQQMIQEMDQQGKEMRDELRHIRAQLETLTTPVSSLQSSPQMSYASAAGSSPRTQSISQSNLPAAKSARTPVSDSLYCTVVTSRVEEANKSQAQIGNIRKAIESDMRKSQSQESWKCAAVVKDARNPGRIRILCRDEAELKQVKEAAHKAVTLGARRTAVLDAEGNVLPGAAEALGAENNVTIAKITWLSNRGKAKAYGSMVIYVTKESDAQRLLDGVWFDLAGESACTNVFERRLGPIQCFNCQEIGHKAFSCKKPQTCGRCAKAGHHHRECKEAEPKCVPCGGPHESFSRNCRARAIGDEAQAGSHLAG